MIFLIKLIIKLTNNFILLSILFFFFFVELASLQNLKVLDLSYNQLESYQLVQGTSLTSKKFIIFYC